MNNSIIATEPTVVSMAANNMRAETEKQLSALNFWDKLSSVEKDTIVNAASRRTYAKGDSIHSGNVRCTGVIFIVTGSAKVYMLSEDGREITLYRLLAGEYCVLSASCVLKSITFDVFVEAEEPTEALIISPKVFLGITESNVYAENCALQTAVERFSAVMWAMQQLLFMKMDKRLAVYLYDKSLETKNLILKTTHDEIASDIGSSREVVTRMLKYFSQEGYVKTNRGSIEIVDKKGLFDLAK